jgi:alpha-galactosidase
MDGSWDGFQRINTDTKTGGIIGVFRRGAIEANRLVTINDLNEGSIYQVKTMDGKVITSKTGREL